MWKVITCVLLVVIMVETTSGSAFYVHEGIANPNSLKLNNDVYQVAFSDKLLFAPNCACVDFSCGCCAHLNIHKLHVSDTGCVNMTYLPEDSAFVLTCTIDNWVIFNKTISVRNPPSRCFGAEYLPDGGVVCLRFYDSNIMPTKLHRCVGLYAKIKDIVIAEYDLGCFDVGHK